MKKISETIVFFGSGPVAAQSLELLAKNFEVEAVITKPKPVHHKASFPVLDMAEKLKLPVLLASNKSELDSLAATKRLTSRLGILVDFGIIVSQQVIDYFPLGIINSHFSILPEWRGADPIVFAILSGQKQTGVSTMLLVEALDEGPLLGYGEYDIPKNATAPELTDNLINLSDALLRHDVPRYLETNSRAPQSITGREVSYSRKLTKQDGIIDWSKPAEQLEREIRGFIDWPKSRTSLAGKEVIITQAHVKTGKGKPGDIWKDGKRFGIYTGKDSLEIDRLKPAGKPQMTAQAFIAGYGSKL